jgi:hypothetical protein
MRSTTILGIWGSLMGWLLLIYASACAPAATPEPVHDASLSFSPYCWHPSGAHLCILAYAVPASDSE